MRVTEVSIHATLAGGDRGRRRRGQVHNSFYPRHPRGWRRDCKSVRRLHQSFYPRHPRGWRRPLILWYVFAGVVSIHATLAGGDARWVCSVVQLSGFLSTPPSRVATGRGRRQGPGKEVSIHATLAGGDRGSVARGVMAICFYPRHPRGWRLPHGNSKADPTASFYPRHPRGWRPSSTDPATPPSRVSIHATLAGGDELAKPGRKLTQSVSIHATLAGGDPQSEREPLGSRCFYPRHPRGWRLMR